MQRACIIKASLALSLSALAPCISLDGVIGFYTAGQRVTPGDCSTGFVWKPYPGASFNLTYTDWATAWKEPNCELGPGETQYESCIQYKPTENYQWNDIDCGLPSCPVCSFLFL